MLVRCWQCSQAYEGICLPPPAFCLQWVTHAEKDPSKTLMCTQLPKLLLSVPSTWWVTSVLPLLPSLLISWQASSSHKNVIPPLHCRVQSRPSYYGLPSQLWFPRHGAGGKLTPRCPGRNAAASQGWHKHAGRQWLPPQKSCRCLPKELPKSLQRKAAAAEQAVLRAGGSASSSDPRSHAKSSGYEMAKILEDAIFCSLIYLITTKVRKGLPWKGVMRLLRHENQTSTGMTRWKLRAWFLFQSHRS